MSKRIPTGLPPAHLALCALTLLPYFVNLGVSSLWDSNESFYAETPREMLQSGDFLLPKFNSQPRAQKPPLTYWPIAFCYTLFGINEFSVRLPGAFAASGLMLFVYLTGRLLFTSRAALLSMLLTGTTMRIMLLARKLPIDILLLLFLSGAAYFLVRGITRNSTSSWILAYAFISLGFLTKGPVAVVIPFGTCIAWALWSRRLSLRQMRLLPGVIIFSGLALPWYILVYLRSGWEYIAPFLLRDNLGRLAGEGLGPSRSPFYYVVGYLGEFFPWSILSIAALACLWRMRASVDLRRNLAWGFPLTWSLLVFAFFTASVNKQAYYIAPIYPMMALLLAAVLDRELTETGGVTGGPWHSTWKPALVAITVLFLCCVLVLPLLIGPWIPGIAPTLQFGPSLVLLGAAAALVWGVARRRLDVCIAVLFTSWWLLMLAIPAFYLPAAERFRPIRSLCAELQPLLSPEDEVGYYRAAAPSMLFYLRRPIFEEWKPEKMAWKFQSPNRVFCIMNESDRNHFVGERILVLYVLARRPQLASRFRDLTDHKSRPGRDLVLVCNQRVDLGIAADRRREAP